MKTKKNKLYGLEEIFKLQKEFQELLGNKVPADDPELFAHHMLGLITEVGEIAQSDKRWKRNKRNKHYDRNNKVEEIADAYIFLINICLFSDVGYEELEDAIVKKIEVNINRYKGEKE